MGATLEENKWGIVDFVFDANVTVTNTTQESDITIVGLTTDMWVGVCKPSHSTGVGIVNARVKAADTLSITYVNATGSGVNPASETYRLLWIKGEHRPSVVNPL